MNNLCSHERLELALAGSIDADDESTLHRHLDECELCAAEMERLAGGERARKEIASMLVPDDLDDALPPREECSTTDFVVDHLEPSDDAAVLGRLGAYDVLDIIGRGGMGVVLKGFDRELKRFVAIKALAPHLAHSALARKRFAREAQAAAAVVNPHVIAIHQVQPGGQLPFLVMPLLTGESLAQRLTARGTLELMQILRIGMQAADGLAAAHGQGLIHRDVKPANILLEKGVERAVLTDFGLARAADDVSMTRWGIIAGTPEYMSPEQARGEALDGRSDLFSLGCVLYEMATGVSPFRADSTMATLRRIVDEKPAAMASLSPDLPRWFTGIVERLLSKDPAERFASAEEVSQLLEHCLSHLQHPTSVSLPAFLVAKGVAKGADQRSILTPLLIGGIIMFGSVSLALLGMLMWQASEDHPESFVVQTDREAPAKIEKALLPTGPRAQSAGNMGKIILAMYNYAVAHEGQFPPAVMYGKDGKGKAPHSWRVELLPYLQEEALYEAYRFDEPWDSEANKKVLVKMPAVFRDPSDDLKSTRSAYYVLVGKANEMREKDEGGRSGGLAAPGGAIPDSAVDTSLPTAFSKTQGIRFQEILDGASNTIGVVEAKRDIPWTKPEDIPYDPTAKAPKLGGFYDDGFHVGMCDRTVKFLPQSISKDLLRAYLSPAGLEPIAPQKSSPAGEP